MKNLGMLCCGFMVVGLMVVKCEARIQYQTALLKQIKDPSVRDVQAAMAKLGTSSKQCAYCHGKKKSELTSYGQAMARFLLDREYVIKDPKNPAEYVYVKEKWQKDDAGNYSQDALDVLTSALQAASKR